MSTETTPQGPETRPPSRVSAMTFRSWKAIVLWACIAAYGLWALRLERDGPIRILDGLLALFAIQAAVSFALGVRLTENSVALPLAPWARIPVLAFGRTSIPLATVREMFSWGRVAILAAGGGHRSALFDSKKRRRAFMKEVRRRQPKVAIYRVETLGSQSFKR